MREFLYNNKRYQFFHMPSGEVYTTDNLKKFSLEMGVDYPAMTKLINGKARRVGEFILVPGGNVDGRGRVYLGV